MSHATTRTANLDSKTATLLALPSAVREPVQNPRRHGSPPKDIPFLPRLRKIKSRTFDLAAAQAELRLQAGQFVEANQQMVIEREKFVQLPEGVARTEYEIQRDRYAAAFKNMVAERDKFYLIDQAIDRYHGIYRVVQFRARPGQCSSAGEKGA